MSLQYTVQTCTVNNGNYDVIVWIRLLLCKHLYLCCVAMMTTSDAWTACDSCLWNLLQTRDSCRRKIEQIKKKEKNVMKLTEKGW